MTTSFPFQPSSQAPFTFNPTLDGQIYTATVTWNVAGQRWYLTITTLQGSLVINYPAVTSPDDYDINLVPGVFQTSTIVFRASSNAFEVSP